MKNSLGLINSNHHNYLKKTKGILKRGYLSKPKKPTISSLFNQSKLRKLSRDKKKSGIKRNNKKKHD